MKTVPRLLADDPHLSTALHDALYAYDLYRAALDDDTRDDWEQLQRSYRQAADLFFAALRIDTSDG